MPTKLVDVSPLTELGYKVGENGRSQGMRRHILRKAFQGALPPTQSPEYMKQWGAPGSEQRLRRLAEQLAGNIRMRNRMDSPPFTAIGDWEEDLAWLKVQFYDGVFSFLWPDPYSIYGY